jgi:chorismate-pyruvate lyase
VNHQDLRAALDRTSGTVTDFLEQLVGERIFAQAHRNDIVEARIVDGLAVNRGEPLLHRAATLRGCTSGSSYVYAESIIAVGRLPTKFYDQLVTTNDPIGRVLEDLGITITRESVDGGDGTFAPRPNGGVDLDGHLLARAYRIDSEATAVMIITEWFLKTLREF